MEDHLPRWTCGGGRALEWCTGGALRTAVVVSENKKLKRILCLDKKGYVGKFDVIKLNITYMHIVHIAVQFGLLEQVYSSGLLNMYVSP